MLTISPSPHIHSRRSTRMNMTHVLIALIPSVLVALFFFGLPALIVILVAVVTAMTTEWAVTRYMLRKEFSLNDCSAALTGLLLALTLPSSLPWWTVMTGTVFAVGVGKMAFGGLGCNIFNPALVGRVFLLISFPALMTTWPVPGWGFCADVDGTTAATWLTMVDGNTSATWLKSIETPTTFDLLIGFRGGSMGEVGCIAIIIGWIYLMATRVITWVIPAVIIATTAIFDLIIGAPVTINLLSGGLLFGAVFMATDYVTSPITGKGMAIYAIIIAVITVVIRQWGAYPEGISFAILVGNAVTPLINKCVRPTRFSPRKKSSAV